MATRTPYRDKMSPAWPFFGNCLDNDSDLTTKGDPSCHDYLAANQSTKSPLLDLPKDGGHLRNKLREKLDYKKIKSRFFFFPHPVPSVLRPWDKHLRRREFHLPDGHLRSPLNHAHAGHLRRQLDQNQIRFQL